MNRDCYFCENCIPICEGDFLCSADDLERPIIIISDYAPTDKFYQCGGRDFIEEEFW